MKKNYIIIIYSLIWIIPIYILMKDFFKIDSLNYIKDSYYLRILLNTIIQALLSSVFSFIVAIVPAIYVSKSKSILSKILEASIFIPFFFPPISAVIAFSLIYSNYGILNNLGMNINIMYTLKGVVMAHIFYNSPIFVKYISSSIRSIPNNIIENAELEGSNKIKLFLKIQIPMIFPSILRAFFLVFTYSFTSFAIVMSIGGLRYSTLEVAISNALRGNLDFSKALSLAILQFIILLILNIFTTTNENYEIEYKTYDKKVNKILLIGALIYFIFEYSIIITGILSSVYDFINMKFDIEGLKNIFSTEFNNKYPVIKSIINSLSISFISAITSTLIAYIILKNYTKFSNIIILSTLGISSAFLATSLLYMNILYNINYVILLVIGFILITIPISYSFLYQHVLGFKKEILEAGAIDGANKLKIFTKIELPILFPILISTFMQIFAIIYGEFTITYTMQLRDYLPLVSVVNFTISSSRLIKESSALSAINVLIIFMLFLISNKIQTKYIKN
ncbi:thiamine transport system permease protein [Oceanotoga teriensis]|jgi:thiamine transport system permease protein|uniref:Thiamine transport system permease protein n=1 Tax=Oceanotoga teriensis TaxID=515440 RepID=A0AA45C7E0_9BACT|nr:ABC transporter permease subunit [Oceanotoga teriensis]PWJ95249.1 thiamine transport system permease protein [Oceanotoga teriensis]